MSKDLLAGVRKGTRKAQILRELFALGEITYGGDPTVGGYGGWRRGALETARAVDLLRPDDKTWRERHEEAVRALKGLEAWARKNGVTTQAKGLRKRLLDLERERRILVEAGVLNEEAVK